VRHILEREHAIVAQLSAERVRNSGLIRSLQEKAVSAQNELNAKASALSQELQKLEQKDKAISKLQDELQILRRKYINSASEWYKDQTAARQRLQESEKSLQLANGQLDEERTTSLGLRLDVERLTRKKNESDRLLAEIRGRLDKLQQGYVGVTLRNRSHGAPGSDGPASAQEHSRHGAASVAGPLILPQCLSRAGISTRTSADDLSAIDPRARTNPKAQPAKEFPSERTNVLLLPTASTGSELETQTIDTSDLLW
jgi:cation transport regulator ChaB